MMTRVRSSDAVGATVLPTPSAMEESSLRRDGLESYRMGFMSGGNVKDANLKLAIQIM